LLPRGLSREKMRGGGIFLILDEGSVKKRNRLRCQRNISKGVGYEGMGRKDIIAVNASRGRKRPLRNSRLNGIVFLNHKKGPGQLVNGKAWRVGVTGVSISKLMSRSGDRPYFDQQAVI